MARVKFVSDKIWDVKGFFNPHDDNAEIHGKLLEFKVPTHDQTAGGFIVELSAPCKNIVNRDGEALTCKKGDRVALNRFTALYGLERQEYSGKTIHVKIVGKKTFTDGNNPAFMAEVEVED